MALILQGTEIIPKFSDQNISEPSWVMDLRAFASWMSAPTCSVFQDSEYLTDFCPAGLHWDIRADVRRTSSPQTYSLGCFSFLNPDHGLFAENMHDIEYHC